MKQERIDSLLKHQTAIARKVYDRIPALIHEATTVDQLVRTMYAAGIRIDHSTCSGILFSLRDDKLIHMSDGRVWRVAPSADQDGAGARAEAVTAHKAGKEPKAEQAPPQADMLGTFAELAARAQAMGKQLQELATAIGDAALAAAEMRQQADRDAAQLRQLRALLREVV